MSRELPWWQMEKARSLARRSAEAAAESGVKAGDAFLIVTEGIVTEPIYFDLLRKDLQLSAVQICVMPGRAPDPRHVIETACEVRKAHSRRAKKGTLGISEPQHFDHVWAVVDTDVAVRQAFWSEVESLAASRGVKLAHSTPCFEFWLLLHIQGYTTRGDLVNGETAKAAVKYALGTDYSTNRQTATAVISNILGKWPEAVIHAGRVGKHHQDVRTLQPANPSTEVCRLVRALNDSAPMHARKIK